MPTPIRVLVTDDSALMRKLVTEILAQDPGITVVGQARDGADALKKVEALRPDVLTLDIEMPVMDGVTTLTELMKTRPLPVVMVSSLTQAGAEITLRCLTLGAVDFIGKPSGSISLDIASVGRDLTAKVKAAATARIPGAAPRPAAAFVPAPVLTPRPGLAPKALGTVRRVLMIGSSTGGPRALQTLVPALPGDLGVPVVIVQHMPPGFTASLAARLNGESPLCIREAKEGDALRPNEVLVAPGGHHLEFDAQGHARLTDEPPVHGVRPSVDVTLASLTSLYGAGVVAVVLTGMGRDGARAMKCLRDHGGHTLAEDESTCVVYGMPKAAVELGGVDELLPLPQLAGAAARAVRADLQRKPA